MADDTDTVIGSDLERVREEIPEIALIEDPNTQEQLARVWMDFLRESSYATIAECPAFPGMPSYDLARHTRHVIKNCAHLGDTLSEFWDVSYDREALLAAAVAHDASKLVEYEGPDGHLSELGNTLLHAQLAGVRCIEAGLSSKVAYMVAYHPFTPPHVHLTPKYLEFVILSWADLAAVDPLFMLEGMPTHLQIEKRFFSLD